MSVLRVRSGGKGENEGKRTARMQKRFNKEELIRA